MGYLYLLSRKFWQPNLTGWMGGSCFWVDLSTWSREQAKVLLGLTVLILSTSVFTVDFKSNRWEHPLRCLHTIIRVTVSVQKFPVLFCFCAMCQLEKKLCPSVMLWSHFVFRKCSGIEKAKCKESKSDMPMLAPFFFSFHRKNFKCLKNILTLNKELVSQTKQKNKSLNLEHKKLQTKVVALSISFRGLLDGFIRSLLQQNSSWNSPQLCKVDTSCRWPYL